MQLNAPAAVPKKTKAIYLPLDTHKPTDVLRILSRKTKKK